MNIYRRLLQQLKVFRASFNYLIIFSKKRKLKTMKKNNYPLHILLIAYGSLVFSVAAFAENSLNLKVPQRSYYPSWDEEAIKIDSLKEKYIGEFDQSRSKKGVINSNPYRSLVPSYSGSNSEISAVPDNYIPWWRNKIQRPLLKNAAAINLNLETLYIRALDHSSQIDVFRDLPLIRETAILESTGKFDPHLFMDGFYKKTNEPVGSTLRTGGADRFKEHEWNSTVGLRKKVITGGEVEISQKLSGIDNNSSFFVPNDQAVTRLQLSFTQPLLNGGGIEYNRSIINIAKLDHEVALDEFQRQVESHLLAVSRGYWSLYLERAILLQKQRLVQATEKIVSELNSRRDLDVLPSDLARSRAALSQYTSELMRAGTAVRNAEDRLVSLVNDQELRGVDKLVELIPSQAPALFKKSLSEQEAVNVAMHNRPEISQALKQLKASMIRADMSDKELLPILDFYAKWYGSGLNGDYNLEDSLGDQYTNPGSYELGLHFDYPLGNNAAEARNERRRLEVRQLQNQLRTTMQTVTLEVQVTQRELDAAWNEMAAKYASMQATGEELLSLQKRTDIFDGSNMTVGVYLRQILDAQERLSEAEAGFLSGLVTYNLALVNMDRATGLFLQSRELVPQRIEAASTDSLPSLNLRH
jgi:outer membrane protein TolC